jgi:DNA repair protein RecO (recombination protein O)
MRRTTSERLIILKRRQHNEHDAIITAFSPQRGCLRLLVKGLTKPQSKLAGHLEPLTVIDGLIVWGQLPLLSAAVSRQSFGNLKNQLAAVVLASQIINRYQRWCPLGQAMPDAWSDLLQLLTAWDNQPQSLVVMTLGAQAIQWRLAGQLGLIPDLDYCITCRHHFDSAAWWSLNESGLFCANCRPADATVQLAVATRHYWQMMLGDDWLELTKSLPSPTILEQITGFFNEWLNFLDNYVC